MAAKYYLYRNLHKGGFSIKHKGKVIARPSYVTMNDVEFKVSEVGRQRVIKEQVKNVHAYVVADNYNIPTNLLNFITGAIETQIEKGYYEEVTYNPYNKGHFFIKRTNASIYQTEYVVCINGKVYIPNEY